MGGDCSESTHHLPYGGSGKHPVVAVEQTAAGTDRGQGCLARVEASHRSSGRTTGRMLTQLVHHHGHPRQAPGCGCIGEREETCQTLARTSFSF